MARETGWTLAYIDGLSLMDWLDYWSVAEGLHDLKRFGREA